MSGPVRSDVRTSMSLLTSSASGRSARMVRGLLPWDRSVMEKGEVEDGESRWRGKVSEGTEKEYRDFRSLGHISARGWQSLPWCSRDRG